MRSQKIRAVVVGTLCLFLILGQSVFARTVLETKPEKTTKESLNYVPGEIIIKFKKDKINLAKTGADQKIRSFSDSAGLLEKANIKKSNVVLFKTADGKDASKKVTDEKKLFDKINELKNDSSVEYAQPNFQYYPSSTGTNDTYKDNLWALDNTGQTVNGVIGSNDADIDAPEAWAINEGDDNSVIVAVIDSGVAYNHPDLLSNMWDGSTCKDDDGNALGNCNYGYDYEDDDKTPLPSSSTHGTHVAGTIAAVKNNSKGTIGVTPHAKIMALKSSLTSYDNVRSINFAKQNGAKVINASWGSYGTSSVSYDVALYDAIDAFPGLFISAAGNAGFNHEDGVDAHKIYPAGFKIATAIGPGLDNIIAVAVTDQNDSLASWSDYGATTVDVGAPGANIYSTVPSESTILSEPFTSVIPPAVPSGWVKAGTGNNWGTWATIGSWGNVLYGDLATPSYANDVDSTITSPTYNLSSGGANMSFWAACDTQYSSTDYYDYMALEVSGDGSDFTELQRFDEWDLDYYSEEDPYSGTGSSIYHFENLNIPSEYLTSNFKFRFRWITDSSDNTYDGCLVDDVILTKLSDGADEGYGFMDGTSMAAPHVAGLAAFLWSTDLTLTTAEIKDAIVNTGDSLSSLSGKTVSGKRINAKKALDSITPLTPMYRLYNTLNGAYLYTRGDADKTHVMSTWPEFEFTDGVPAFYASLTERDGLTPIYRLYNTLNGMYLYTRGDADKAHVMNTWPEFEFTDGVPAFYASLTTQDGLTPMYRLYNTLNGAYLYTRGDADRDHVLNTWPEFEFTDGVPAFYASLE